MVHNKCESNLFLNQKWQNRLIQDCIYLIQNHLPPPKRVYGLMLKYSQTVKYLDKESAIDFLYNPQKLHYKFSANVKG